jgi:flagellar basal body-associated protein FliL
MNKSTFTRRFWPAQLFVMLIIGLWMLAWTLATWLFWHLHMDATSRFAASQAESARSFFRDLTNDY